MIHNKRMDISTVYEDEYEDFTINAEQHDSRYELQPLLTITTLYPRV